LGDRFLRTVFSKITKAANFWDTIFSGNYYVLILARNGLGYILGDFFSKTHPATLVELHSSGRRAKDDKVGPLHP
jgi:hypothetical protein